MEPVPSPTPRATVSLRRILAIGGGCLLAFLWLWHRDDAPPKDEAFELKSLATPHTENPLNSFLAQLRALPEEGFEPQMKQLRRSDPKFDATAKREFFDSAAARKRIDLWDKFLQSNPKTCH